MRLWGLWRRGGRSAGDLPGERPSASEVRDEQLSAYLDGELDEANAAEVEAALEADPALAAELEELGVLQEALSELGELRAPRPFTLEAPPTRARGGLSRLEIVTRMGAVAAAVAFVVVLTGDFAGLGDEDAPIPVRSEADFQATESLGAAAPVNGAVSDATASDASAGEAAAVPSAAPEPATDAAAAAPQSTPARSTPAEEGGATSTDGRDSALQLDGAAGSGATAPQDSEAAPEPAGVAPPSSPAGGEATVEAMAAGGDEESAAPAAAADDGSLEEAAPADADTPAVAPVAPGEDDRAGSGEAQVVPQPTEAPAPAAAATTEAARPLVAPAAEQAGDDSGGALQIIELALLIAAAGLAGVALLQRLTRRGGRAV